MEKESGKLVKELDFEVVEEKWITINVKDGSVIRFKPVLIKVFKTNMKDPETGEPLYGYEGQNVLSVRSPEELRGNPSENLPSVPDALKMSKEEIEFDIKDPSWNIYELTEENNKRVKIKPIIISVFKIKDVFDRFGNPYYIVRSQLITSSSPSRLQSVEQTATESKETFPSYSWLRRFTQVKFSDNWIIPFSSSLEIEVTYNDLLGDQTSRLVKELRLEPDEAQIVLETVQTLAERKIKKSGKQWSEEVKKAFSNLITAILIRETKAIEQASRSPMSVRTFQDIANP